MGAPEDANSTETKPDATSDRAEDVVFVHGPTEHGVQITRLRDEQLEAGELRPLKEGQPVVGEIVKLSQRQESDRLFDVEVLAKGPNVGGPSAPSPRAPQQPLGHKGPPRVATDRFRSNWEQVFASRKKGDLPS